jgi:hypothetical protein
MAAVVTADTIQTTGVLANTSSIGPRLIYATGTWDANGAATTTISTTYTGMSYIIGAGISVSDSGAVSEMPAWGWNINGAGAAALGSIGLTDHVDDTNNTGNWWAIGVPL